MVSVQSADDMGDRSSQAEVAAHLIYNSIGSNSTISNTTDSRYKDVGSSRCCKGRMSAVRRTFCLVTLFDFIFTFILWVIYTQIAGSLDIHAAFKQEVVNYNFGTSLFDTVLLAFWRFLVLILSYALLMMRRPWMVAVTTFGTCVFLLIKVFLFKFNKSLTGENNTLDYLVLILSFIIAWVETWLLDFKVLPQEKKVYLRDQQQSNSNHYSSGEREPLLSGRSRPRYDQSTDQYYSPIDTPADSDDEVPKSAFHSIPPSRSHSRTASHGSINVTLGVKEKEFIQKAKEGFETALEILSSEDGWKLDTTQDNGVQVHSKTVPNLGKFFKLQGELNMEPKKCFEEMIFNAEDQPSWNPTVLEIRTLQVLDDSTDITYYIAAEAAGGMVSSRDFVSLRHWETRPGMYISGGVFCTHPDMPEQKKYVRGENGPGCWVFKEIPGEPNKCDFIWLLNTNLKGWLPQYLVDQSLAGAQMDLYKGMIKHIEELNELDSGAGMKLGMQEMGDLTDNGPL